MDFNTWNRLYDVIHSPQPAADKDDLLLNIAAEDAMFTAQSEEEKEGIADFLLELMKLDKLGTDPLNKIWAAHSVAVNVPIDSAKVVSALTVLIREVREPDSDFTVQQRWEKFTHLGDTVKHILISGLREKRPELVDDLFGLYPNEAIKYATVDPARVIKTVTDLLIALPPGMDDIKGALRDTVVQVTEGMVQRGATALRQGEPRAQPVRTEAQASA